MKPVAFMSYVRNDDVSGRLSHFREALSLEVRTQTGEEFPIFQDRSSIQWGENWKDRIASSLSEVSFLIPIVTPAFFKSPACRCELEQFIKHERKLHRNDLVLPVYYVECPLLSNETKRATDKLAQAIWSHQYVDWRELRLESPDSTRVAKRLAELASHVRDALERVNAFT